MWSRVRLMTGPQPPTAIGLCVGSVIPMLIAHFVYKEEVYIEGIKIRLKCKYGWHIPAVAVLATYSTAAYSTV